MSGQTRRDRGHGRRLHDDIDILLARDSATFPSLGAFLTLLRLDARVEVGQSWLRAEELALVARLSRSRSTSEVGLETTDLIVDLDEMDVGKRTDSVEEVCAGSRRMPGRGGSSSGRRTDRLTGRSRPDVGGTHSEHHENTIRV